MGSNPASGLQLRLRPRRLMWFCAAPGNAKAVSGITGNREAGLIRRVLHILFAAASWILFVDYWILVLGQPMSSGLRVALGFVAITLVLVPLLVYLWILHNLGLAKRWSHRRRGRRDPGEDFREDFLGRSLGDSDLHSLQAARELVIELAGERKRYRAADEDAAGGRPTPGTEEVR